MSWWLLAMSPGTTAPLLLADGVHSVFAEEALPRLERAGGPLTLFVSEAELDVERGSSGAGEVKLNDLPLSRRSRAQAGDVLTVGAWTLLVMEERGTSAAEPLLSHEQFEATLAALLDDAAERGESVSLRILRGEERPTADARLRWGRLAPGWLEVASAGPELALEGVVGRATAPEDGTSILQLMETALDPLFPSESANPEPVFADPVMLHLSALLDRLSRDDAPVLLEGATGVGRRMLARLLHIHGQRTSGRFVPVRAAGLSREALEQAAHALAPGDTVFFQDLEQWEVLRARAGGPRRVGSCAPLASGTRAPGVHRVRVPRLLDRPSEILPLAEHFLLRGRTLRRASPLTLSAEAKDLFRHYPWPGNVRELRVALERASLLAEAEEIRPHHLPQAVRSSEALRERKDLRHSLKSAEKDAMLQVLGATGWNVTESAKRLGLPRRTVVYRMRRLQLKRPPP